MSAGHCFRTSDMTAVKRVWLESTKSSPMQTGFSFAWLVARRRRAVVRPFGARPNAVSAAGLIALLGFARDVGAQSNGKGFLFKRPVGSFSFRAGYAMANAASDVFEDATTQLTLDKKDFSGFDLGGDISYSMADRFDLVFDG